MTAPLTDRLRALAEQWKARAANITDEFATSRDRVLGEVATIEAAMRVIEGVPPVLKFAQPTRGPFCTAECLGQCRECKALWVLRTALAAPEGGARG